MKNILASINRFFDFLFGPVTFDKMSPAQKRVAIAKDVIAIIDAKLVKVNQGKYIKLGWKIPLESSVKEEFENLHDYGCEVCAMGACLLSIIHFENNFLFSELEERTSFGFVHDKKIRTALEKHFEKHQLALIEGAFEGSYEHNDDDNRYVRLAKYGENPILDLSDETKRKIDDFYSENNKSSKERLIKIMQNIIDNKGTFIL